MCQTRLRMDALLHDIHAKVCQLIDDSKSDPTVVNECRDPLYLLDHIESHCELDFIWWEMKTYCQQILDVSRKNATIAKIARGAAETILRSNNHSPTILEDGLSFLVRVSCDYGHRRTLCIQQVALPTRL